MMQIRHYTQNELGEWWDAILETGTKLYTARQTAKGQQAQAAAVQAQARAVQAQAAAELARERTSTGGGSERDFLMMQLLRPKGMPRWVVPAGLAVAGLGLVWFMMQKR